MITQQLMASSNPLDHVVAHDLFKVGPITVNNHMVMLTVAAVLMLMVFPVITRRQELVPTGVRNFFESICMYLRDEVARPVLQDQTDRFIGLLWTIFFFILFCNLLGMVPISSLIYLASQGRFEEYGGTATANIYVTGALAGMMFVMIHLFGIWKNALHCRHEGKNWLVALMKGTGTYCYRMVPPIGGKMGIVLFVPLFILESMGMLVKSVALAVRLFANMLAGHILLAVLILFISMSKTLYLGLFVAGVSVIGSVAISLLELFVAFLQAYIFTFLATIFIGMAVNQEH